MKTALIINGSKKFGNDGTRLNTTLHEVAKNELEAHDYKVLETFIDKGYEPESEVQKIAQSELIIYQMPAWWMGEPWIVKKYMDEVFMRGYGVLFSGDGRSRADESKKYGTGGLSQGKRVIFSTTWNAPAGAFTESGGLFEGVGADMVYLHLRKAHEFLGMSVLPVFMCNDVVKNPQIDLYIANFKAYLSKYVFCKDV